MWLNEWIGVTLWQRAKESEAKEKGKSKRKIKTVQIVLSVYGCMRDVELV